MHSSLVQKPGQCLVYGAPSVHELIELIMYYFKLSVAVPYLYVSIYLIPTLVEPSTKLPVHISEAFKVLNSTPMNKMLREHVH